MAVEKPRDLQRDWEYLGQAAAHADEGPLGEAAARSILEIAQYWIKGIPEKFVLVPIEPPEEMWDGLPRDIVMWSRFQSHAGCDLYQHLRSLGRPIPEWLLKEIPDTAQVPPKGTVAVCIFKAMIEQRPKGMP